MHILARPDGCAVPASHLHLETLRKPAPSEQGHKLFAGRGRGIIIARDVGATGNHLGRRIVAEHARERRVDVEETAGGR